MFTIFRRFNFKYFFQISINNKSTEFITNVSFHRNKLRNIISYTKHKISESFKSRRFSFKYLSKGSFIFITALCFEKDNHVMKESEVQHDGEKCRRHSDTGEYAIECCENEKCGSKEISNKDRNTLENGKKCNGEDDNSDGKKDEKSYRDSGSKGEEKQNMEEIKNDGDHSAEKLEKTRDRQNHDVLFMEAAKFGNVHDIKRLLKQGVDVNQRHPYGWTALHVAAINGHFRIVAELLSNGADPNLGDNFSDVNEVAWEKQLKNEEVMAVRKQDFFPKMKMEGNCANFTALHYAVLIQDHDIVSLLLRSGADPTFISETGFSPLDFAKSDKMKNLLKKYMEKDDEDIMKLHSYVQRLVRKGYSVNITTPESEQKEGSPNVIGPVKLQIKKLDTDKIIKDVNIGIKSKNFVTV